ncbi:MAG: type I 3-dehydroquinate dehydratase [Legionellales bacterium]|jgi:3-dehydroquinate dehydratase/shikimate dehydrogenase
MLTAIIPIHSIESAQVLIQQAHHADVLEFRLDYLSEINFDKIKLLQVFAKKPVLFTLRKPEQGGVYQGNEAQRLAIIEKLITLNPDYLDIEHDVALAFCQKLKSLSSKTKLICSYHNFVNTPDDLQKILNTMINPVFDVYKIITTAESILDTLQVIEFLKQNSQHHLITHAMGEVGVTSRILGKVFGNYFTYASVDTQNIAPGLLTLDELVNIYHYPTLNDQTKVYGLIGDPVIQSIGHIYHNAEFVKHHQNAVYVKFHVKPEELEKFMNNLFVEGLSVTMPHKQAVLAFCSKTTDAVKAIGAANTLIKTQNGFLAANTDGEAVVKILPQDLNNKKVVVLGAGGAANSIIYSLKKTGAQVLVYNRTQYSVDILPLKQAKQATYDILINTIPAKHYNPQDINFIKDKIIMDANYQATSTQLIQDGLKHGCQCIEGQAMFYAQAKLQRELWFKQDE